jgi:hypothetical protein
MAHGIKTGGRKKGTKNKPKVMPTTAVEEAIVASVTKGQTPLEYMLDVMRDRAQEYPRRDEMARAAAPYVHARLAAAVIEHTGTIIHEARPSSEVLAEIVKEMAELGVTPEMLALPAPRSMVDVIEGVANKPAGKNGSKP